MFAFNLIYKLLNQTKKIKLVADNKNSNKIQNIVLCTIGQIFIGTIHILIENQFKKM